MSPVCALVRPLLRKHIKERFDCNVQACAQAYGFKYYWLYSLQRGELKSMSFFHALRLWQILEIADDSLLRETYREDFEFLRELFSKSNPQ